MPKERLSAKLQRVEWPKGSPAEYVPTMEHHCPGCGHTHAFAVERPFRNGSQWSFDGNLDRPTFNPSMNIRIGPYPHEAGEAGRIDVCHYFLHDGRIQFLGDCTHALRGQIVELPDLPAP